MTNEKIIGRIKRLILVAQQSNSEHEAATAADLAASLLAEHNLTQTDLEARPARGQYIIDGSLVTPTQPWRSAIAETLAKYYFCTYFVAQDGGWTAHTLCGEPHNVAVAKLMLEYLWNAVDRLATAAAKGSGEKFADAFRAGCAVRLRTRLVDRLAKARRGLATAGHGETKNLPALADLHEQSEQQITKFLTDEFGADAFEPAKEKLEVEDERGLMEGLAAGNKIGLDAQVGTDRNKRRRLTSG